MEAIVILAAAAPKRGKIPKPATKIGKESILHRQVRIFRKFYPTAPIVIVLGFGATQLMEDYGRDIYFVFNFEYARSGQALSSYMGGSLAKELGATNVMFVAGDLVFDPKGFKNLPKQFIMTGGIKQRSEVGVLKCRNDAITLGYTYRPRWAQSFALCDEKLDLFLGLTEREPFRMNFELLNHVLPVPVFENKYFLADVDGAFDAKLVNNWNENH